MIVYYLLAVLADAGITATFSCNKIYRDHTPYTVKSIAWKITVGAFCTFLLFWAVNGFAIQVNGFILLMAFCMLVATVLSEIVVFTAYGKGQMSLFTVFQMQGGMLLPFLYGIAYGNRLTLWRIVGICMMAAALFLTVHRSDDKQKLSRGFILLCTAIFFLNGTISIISYIYSNGESTLGAQNYMIIKSLMTFVPGLLVCLALRGKDEGETISAHGKYVRGGVVVLGSLIDAGAYFLQLVSAAHLPAVVLYPVITGGTVVLTAFVGRLFFHEKHNRVAIAGFALSFLAIALFALE